MSAAVAVAATELRRFTRDRTALFFVFVLPFVVIIVIGTTFSAAPTSLAIGVVVQPGADDTVAGAVDDADTLEARRFDSRGDLDVAIRTGAVAGGVVVRTDGVTMVLDQADSNSAAVRSTLSGVLVRLQIEDAVSQHLAVDLEAVHAIAAAVPPVGVARTIVDEGLGEADNPFAYTAPSNLVLFTFINSLAAGGVLVAARRTGITQRWAAAPVRPRSLVGGVLLSRLVFALFQAAVIVVVGWLLFDVRWGDPVAAVVVVLLFALISTGSGVLAGTIARTEDQASAFGVPIAIGLGMLGGCMWPLEVVGPTMRTVGHLTPHAWAMDAFITLVFDGGGIADVATEVVVLAAFAAAILALAVGNLSRRLV